MGTFKFAELTTKDLPGCVPKPEKPKGKGRAFTFFLRPRYYKLLPPEERPNDWEKYAKEDEVLYEEECKKAEEEKAIKDQQMKDMMGNGTSSKSDSRSLTP